MRCADSSGEPAWQWSWAPSAAVRFRKVLSQVSASDSCLCLTGVPRVALGVDHESRARCGNWAAMEAGRPSVWPLDPAHRPAAPNRRTGSGCVSVFVVVAFVGGVPVSVVDVVQMVAVEDGGVAASLAVHMDVFLGRLMPR